MLHEQYIEIIIELSKPGGALDPTGDNATIRNPAWFQQIKTGQPEPTGSRSEEHQEIIAEQLFAACALADQQRQALVLAGPPGAGKSSVHFGHSLLGHDYTSYHEINPDAIKEILFSRALEDGSYEEWIKPDEIKKLELEGATFYPMELASLVHEESSLIAKMVRNEAIEQGYNIIIDGVLHDSKKALALGEQLKNADYDIHVVNVEVPFKESRDRVHRRWFEARRTTELGPVSTDLELLGGRWVQSDFSRDIFDTPDGKSKCEQTALKLAQHCTAVTDYKLFRNATRPPLLEKHLKRARGTTDLIPVI